MRRDLQLEELREHGAIVRLKHQIVQEPLEQEALQRQIIPIETPKPPLPSPETPPGPVRIRIILPPKISSDFFIERFEVRVPPPETERHRTQSSNHQELGVGPFLTPLYYLILRNPDHDRRELAAALAPPRLRHTCTEGRRIPRQDLHVLLVRDDRRRLLEVLAGLALGDLFTPNFFILFLSCAGWAGLVPAVACQRACISSVSSRT